VAASLLLGLSMLTTGNYAANAASKDEANRVSVLAELGHIDDVHGLAFSPDNRMLLTTGRKEMDDTAAVLRIWDLSSQKVLRTIENESSETIIWAAFGPDKKRVAVADREGVIKIWGIDGRKVNTLRHLENVHASIRHLSFIDEAQVFSAVNRAPAVIWNVDTNRTRNYQISVTSPLYGAAMTRSGSCFAYCLDTEVVVFTHGASKVLGRTRLPLRHGIRWVVISDDGSRLMGVGGEKSFLIDLKGETVIKSWHAHDAAIYGVTSMPGDAGFVTADEEGNIKIWDSNGKLLTTVRRYAKNVTTLAISPDGSILATAGEQQRIVLWDLKALLKQKK
jgi:WD40 repeat protein